MGRAPSLKRLFKSATTRTRLIRSDRFPSQALTNQKHATSADKSTKKHFRGISRQPLSGTRKTISFVPSYSANFETGERFAQLQCTAASLGLWALQDNARVTFRFDIILNRTCSERKLFRAERQLYSEWNGDAERSGNDNG